MTPEQREFIIRMYKEGKTINEIADKCSYTFSHVYNTLRLWGEYGQSFQKEKNKGVR